MSDTGNPIGADMPNTALTAGEQRQVEQRVSAFVAALAALPPLGPDFSEMVGTIAAIGQRDVSALTACSERAMQHAMQARTHHAGAALAGLRPLARELDPARPGGLLNPGKSLGLFPRAVAPESYFRRFTNAQDEIVRVLAKLERARDDLLREQIRLRADRQQLGEAMGGLEAASSQARHLTTRLEWRVRQLADNDGLRAERLQIDALPQALSRSGELATQMALAQQAWQVLQLIESGNAQVLAAIAQAHAAMLSALHAADRAARALMQRRLVLDKVDALNAATSRIAESGAEAGNGDAREALARCFVELSAALDNLDQSGNRAGEGLIGLLPAASG